MEIKVLGTGCANCKSTMELIEAAVKEKGIEVTLTKVEELQEIMGYGVMSTPGVVVDEKVVHAGGIPDRATIDGWLAGAKDSVSGGADASNCCSGGNCG